VHFALQYLTNSLIGLSNRIFHGCSIGRHKGLR
jgi:hypothetical protein